MTDCHHVHGEPFSLGYHGEVDYCKGSDQMTPGVSRVLPILTWICRPPSVQTLALEDATSQTRSVAGVSSGIDDLPPDLTLGRHIT